MTRSEWRLLAVGLLGVTSFFGSKIALESAALEQDLRLAVAMAPVLPLVAFLILVKAEFKTMDELHRRVQLEALGIAFPLSILLLMVLGLLELAIELPEEDWSYRHVWIFLPIFYFVGLMITWRRYR